MWGKLLLSMRGNKGMGMGTGSYCIGSEDSDSDDAFDTPASLINFQQEEKRNCL